MDPRIADYIRANRKTFTRQAITDQLVEAGHDRAEVDRTWAALEARDPDAVAGEGFWGRFALIAVGINVAVLLIVGLLSGMLTSIGEQSASGVVLVVLAVALTIGALIAWGIVALTGPTRLGRTTAMVIGVSIPLVFALLIGGACYALVGTVGPPPRSGTLQLEVDGVPDLSGSGSATCFLSGAEFSVFGQLELATYTTVDINSFPPEGGPPTGRVENVLILTEGSLPEQQLAYSNFSGQAELDSEMSEGGVSGTVTFTNLGSDLAGPDAPDVDAISGTVTWSCE